MIARKKTRRPEDWAVALPGVNNYSRPEALIVRGRLSPLCPLLRAAHRHRFPAMDSKPLDSPRCVRALEDTLAALDAQLADAEKRAAALLKTARRLRRAAMEGAMASLPAAIAAAQADADRTSEPLAAAAAALDYDV